MKARLWGPIAAFAIALVLVGSAQAAFPGANGKLAFNTSRPGTNDQDVHSINPDGTGLMRLTDMPLSERGPAWSADGTRIAFGAESPAGIYVMNADGTGRTRLTEGGIDPTWSPDGNQIAFMCCSAAAGPLDVWLMNSDGSNQRVFLACCFPDRKGHPAWSPDGSKIAFISDRDRSQGGYNLEIFAAGLGGGLVNLSNSPRDDLHPLLVARRGKDRLQSRRGHLGHERRRVGAAEPDRVWPP